MDIKIAYKFLERGLKIVPTVNKVPRGAGWQNGLTKQEIEAAWSDEINGIGLVTGNGIEALDFDLKYDNSKTLMSEFTDIVNNSHPDLISKMVIQETPSGGYHWIYKCQKIDGNKKLARREATEFEKQNGERVNVLIETRGIGGQIVVQPTEGYKVKQGSLANIQEITPQERDFLMNVAKGFNTYNTKENEIPQNVRTEIERTGLTAFDDYDNRTSIDEVLNILVKHGWTIGKRFGNKIAVKRSGGTTAEHSGYFYTDTNRLYVFSTSTVFEPEVCYKPYAVYTMLEHNGNYTEAARVLYSLGFGDQKEDFEYKHKKDGITTLEKKEFNGFYVKFSEFEDAAEELFKNGNPKGYKTGFSNGDEYMSYRRGFTTIIYAAPFSGKSQFLYSELITLAINEDFKIAVFSQETGAPEDILAEVASIYIGKHYNTTSERLKMTDKQKDEAKRFFEKHFFVIDPLFKQEADPVTMTNVFKTVEIIEKEEGIKIDCVALDPFSEIEEEQSITNGRLDKFVDHTMRLLNNDAKLNNRHNFIVNHVISQAPIVENGQTYFPIPKPRELAGGQVWFRKAYQMICVYRPSDNQIDKDTGMPYEPNTTLVITEKPKPKGVGKRGSFKIYYDWETNRFYQDVDCTVYTSGLRKNKDEYHQTEIDIFDTNPEDAF